MWRRVLYIPLQNFVTYEGTNEADLCNPIWGRFSVETKLLNY